MISFHWRSIRFLCSNVSVSKSDDDDVSKQLSCFVESKHNDGTNKSSSSPTARIIGSYKRRILKRKTIEFQLNSNFNLKSRMFFFSFSSLIFLSNSFCRCCWLLFIVRSSSSLSPVFVFLYFFNFTFSFSFSYIFSMLMSSFVRIYCFFVLSVYRMMCPFLFPRSTYY